MKVGDCVKILEGDHAHEGETGVITIIETEPNENPRYAWDFGVAMDGDVEDIVFFFANELEVIQ
jgi:hypothetical protein